MKNNLQQNRDTRLTAAEWMQCGLPPEWFRNALAENGDAGDLSPRYRRLLPLLGRIADASRNKDTLVVTIDGRAASGKTTMAAELSHLLGAGVVHMDDFFLPLSLRTPERLSSPGGNVHQERFRKEILPRLRQSGEFRYRRFDCAQMDYGNWVTVAASPYRIVEGAYSAHPALGRYMDILAFSDVPPEEQHQRILSRNGQEGWERFTTRWIPWEENYFSHYGIPQTADITL